jgi:hypothetical protein
MRRRAFITLLGGAAAAWPIAARAQQGERMRRIGVLMNTTANTEQQQSLVAFQQALQRLGWTEGRNVQMDVRWAGGDAREIRRPPSLRDIGDFGEDQGIMIGFIPVIERLTVLRISKHRSDEYESCSVHGLPPSKNFQIIPVAMTSRRPPSRPRASAGSRAPRGVCRHCGRSPTSR